MKLLAIAVFALFGLCQAFDMNSVINGMLDNALKDAKASTGSSDTSTDSNSASSSSSSDSTSTSGVEKSSSSKNSGTSSSDNSNTVTGQQQQGFLGQLGGQALDQILPAIKDFTVNAAKTFFNKLLGNQLNRNYHDDILMHRAVRIYKISEKSVIVQDRTSGLKAAGEGATLEEAIENATKLLITALLTTGQMSLLDLGLPEPTKPVQVHCVDNFGGGFCKDMKRRGFCQEGHHMSLFTIDYCRRTCTAC